MKFTVERKLSPKEQIIYDAGYAEGFKAGKKKRRIKYITKYEYVHSGGTSMTQSI